MPTRFLSDAEVARLESFPEAIEAQDLARYFTLDANDLTFVRRQHSPAGQLGVGLQLCSLRSGIRSGRPAGRARRGDGRAGRRARRAAAGDLRLLGAAADP